MKVSRDAAARHRRTIVETAGRLFRERGLDGVGLAELMKEAGFTHGGFYNHFASKEALAAEACAAGIAGSNRSHREKLGPEARPGAWARFVDGYLSREHRDNFAAGCSVAGLAADSGRQASVQEGFAAGLEETLAILAGHLGRAGATPVGARRRAVRSLSQLVGALLLARAVRAADPSLADEILDTNRRQLRQKAKA